MGSIPLYKVNTEPPEPAPKRLKLAEAYCPDGEKQKKLRNTIKSTAWAVKTFQEWKQDRNESFPENPVPVDILDQRYDKQDVTPLVHWLSKFLVEARNKEGCMYSPTSLHGLLCGLLRHMREKNPYTPNFMDRYDPRFKELHVLMNTFANLREQGFRTYRKILPSITLEKENELWGQRILGSNSPISLQRTIYYMISKMFYIKGGVEHRALKPSQFTRERNPDCYTFLGVGSKNNSHHVRKVYADPAAGSRCFVHLFDLFLSKLPPCAFEKDILYLRPKANFLPIENNSPWYETFPVGKEKLRTMTRDMLVDGGLLKTKVTCTNSEVHTTYTEAVAQPSTELPLQPLHQQSSFFVHNHPVSTSSDQNQPEVCVVPLVSDASIPIVKATTRHQAVQLQPGHQISSQPDSVHPTSAVHQRSILPMTDHSSAVRVINQLNGVHQVSIQPSEVSHQSLYQSSPIHQVSVPPTTVQEVSTNTASCGCPRSLQPSIINQNGHQILSIPGLPISNIGQQVLPQSSSAQPSNSYMCCNRHSSSGKKTLCHLANHQISIHLASSSENCLGQSSEGQRLPSNDSKTRQTSSTTPSHTPVQSGSLSKTSIGMPELSECPSREHYEMISKIISAIEMSDDPDLHSVYVCVHKSKRRWTKGGRAYAAEAPF